MARPSATEAHRDQALGYARREVERRRGTVVQQGQDCIAEEVPVAIVYNDQPFAVMMATPADLEDFAIGFSLSEAIVGAAAEISGLRTQRLLEGIELRIGIPPRRQDELARRGRNLSGYSGCGLCGTELLEAALRQAPKVDADVRVAPDALRLALAGLREKQVLNALTGATHAAAWATTQGEIRLLREDVGRHNALDKLIGAMTRAGYDAADGFLLVTSRASYEMAIKAATVGIGFMAAISAPTALAIQIAESAGMTLLGFAREDCYAVYAHAQRLLVS